MDGTTLGVSPEGCLAAGFGITLEHTELMLFIDDERGLTPIENVVGPSPVPPAGTDYGFQTISTTTSTSRSEAKPEPAAICG